ncbi:inorganic phosphate transporter [Haladaptatus sp. T7]|uniref:inorganic phosphate transporter n=1 Tax=Haladaptatus sp. T7 TaxID=2029368 RepID=UPI0021A259C0|nr:inorganic phosphate transporter [Haladaptatus sp. T7]GKZ13214.1 anion permease [Haladaptatus sp. T7]
MVTALLIVGLFVAVFVGYNIGGSSTGVAFGPAVGSRIIGKVGAAALFTGFALLGGWTVGRNVIETMSNGIVPASQFTLVTSIVVLFFAGFALLISNLFGVPASTSMTAVGAIVGLGLASNTLNESLMFTIVSAWIVAPLSAFFVGLVVGRYLYPHLDARFSFSRIEDGLLTVDRSGSIPRPKLGGNVGKREAGGAASVLIIACYMGFSAGASNAANAVAPLIGNGSITASQGILLAIGAIGLGGFTIARRTLDTVSDGITDLPILAALIVSLIGATIITILSRLGIPASLAVSTTSCIIGLGWGRASRAVTVAEVADTALQGEQTPTAELSSGALIAETSESEVPPGPTIGDVADGDVPDSGTVGDGGEAGEVPPIGEESIEELTAENLFDPAATSRIVLLWVLSPTLSAVGSFLIFEFILNVG